MKANTTTSILELQNLSAHERFGVCFIYDLDLNHLKAGANDSGGNRRHIQVVLVRFSSERAGSIGRDRVSQGFGINPSKAVAKGR
jgi:hypothetical protein